MLLWLHQLFSLDDQLLRKWLAIEDRALTSLATEEHSMKLPRRKFLRLTAGAVALPVLPRRAWAQSYPARPVRIIVGFPPGGGVDIMARLIGQSLSERLNEQFIVENRPGAGSNIGTEAVVHATPDGYKIGRASCRERV